jgi:hypothetical protein
VTHTFLVETGRWNLEGHWLDQSQKSILVRGKTIVAWGQDDWYSMVTKLIFPGEEREEITFQYRGRFDDNARRYTFVLQHSELGRVEGEGWITPGAIVQRYWALNDQQRRSGFETLNQISDSKYCLSSGIMTGHQLMSAMDAVLDLQYR